VFAVNETQHQHSLNRPPGLGAGYRLGQGCCPHATSAAKTPEFDNSARLTAAISPSRKKCRIGVVPTSEQRRILVRGVRAATGSVGAQMCWFWRC